MRGLLLCNPSARGGDVRAEATRALRDAGVEVLGVESHSPAEARAAIALHRDEIDLVAAAGGDGTASNLLSALVEHRLPLGLLPLGTANDLARTLAIPADLEGACQIIAGGHKRAVDLGVANGHYFVNAAGLGLQPEVARHVTSASKRYFGAVAYAGAALSAWRNARPFRCRIVADDQEPRTFDTIQLTVGNGRYYGGGLIIEENATIDDALLQVLHVKPMAPVRLLALIPRLYRGTENACPEVWVTGARVVEVQTDRLLSVSLDGEPATHTPVRFEIAAKALEVFVSEDAEERADGLSAAG